MGNYDYLVLGAKSRHGDWNCILLASTCDENELADAYSLTWDEEQSQQAFGNDPRLTE